MGVPVNQTVRLTRTECITVFQCYLVSVALPSLEDALSVGTAELPVVALVAGTVLFVLAAWTIAEKQVQIQ